MSGPWVEKYRPQKLEDIVGQKQIITRLEKYIGEGSMPNLMFTGPAGVGKTTTALALAKSILGEYWRNNFLELNASDARGIDTVRNDIKSFCRLKPVGAPFRIIFLDEVDNMTKDAQHALRREMEMYTKTASFILSCNYSSKIIDPIQSRCAIFRFAPIKGEEIKERLQFICESEGFEADDKGLAKPQDIANMINKALMGDFLGARTLLRETMVLQGTSGEDMVTQIYQEVSKRVVEGKMEPDFYIDLINSIADCDFRIREGANPRIQLEALLTKFI